MWVRRGSGTGTSRVRATSTLGPALALVLGYRICAALLRGRAQPACAVLGVVAMLSVVLATAPGLPVSPASAATEGDAWVIDTLAGSGEPGWWEGGFGGDGGPATDARLHHPHDVAVDDAGNTYIADYNNSRVRKVAPDGTITTVAGTGQRGFSGDGGPATEARIDRVSYLAVDADGNLYIPGGFRVRKVDADGIITTVAGTGERGFSGDGGPATEANLSATGVDFDGNGNLYIADILNNRVRKVDADGIITTVAGNGERGFSGDGGPATEARLDAVGDIAADAEGVLYLADRGVHRVRKVDADGIITTVAGTGEPGYSGDGGPGTQAQLNEPRGVAVQDSGNLFISDYYNNSIRRVDAAGTIDTVAGRGFEGPVGFLGAVRSGGFAGDGGYAPFAQLARPRGIDVDADANLVIADVNNQRIRKVTTSYLWVRAEPNPARVGEPFTYQVSLSGVPSTVSGVRVAATADADAAFAGASASQGSCVGDAETVTCELGTVEPGTAPTVEVTASHLATGVIPIEVTVDAEEPGMIPGRRQVTAYTLASHQDCGRAITADIVLDGDVGPCFDGDGLDIAADDITVDLAGHRVFGDTLTTRPMAGTEAGIRLTGRSGVIVTNGTVSDFSAGVVIDEGSGNTVTGMTLRDNLGPDYEGVQYQPELGDGIFVWNSPDNAIIDNVVIGSGMFDGIGVWGPGSDNTRIEDNLVEETMGLSTLGVGILVNGADLQQGMISGTMTANNTVRHNGGAGLANLNNTYATIANNLVEDNGFGTWEGNGIGVRMGAAFSEIDGDSESYVHVVGNTVRGNAWDGIHIESKKNRITNNRSTDNGRWGGGEYAGIFDFDLEDFSRDPDTGERNCHDNTWTNNTWGSAGYNPECTTARGQGPKSTERPEDGQRPNSAQETDPPLRRSPSAGGQ